VQISRDLGGDLFGTEENTFRQDSMNERINQHVERGASDVQKPKSLRRDEYRLTGTLPLRRFVVARADNDDRKTKFVKIRVDELATAVAVGLDRHDEGDFGQIECYLGTVGPMAAQ